MLVPLAFVVLGTTPVGAAGGPRATTASHVAPHLSKYGVLSAVSCPSVDVCFAAGAAQGITSTGGAGVLKSTNEGASWTAETIPGGVGGYLGISCTSLPHCVAVGVNTAEVNLRAVIAETTDGGARWLARSVPAGVGKLLSVTCPTPSWCEAAGLHYVSSNAGLVTTGVVLSTTNGGATWHAQHVPAALSVVESVSCDAAGTCVTVGENDHGANPRAAGAVTHDGGAAWTLLATPSASSMLLSVSCDRSGACVAVGQAASTTVSYAVRSTSWGANWTRVAVPSDVSTLSRVSCDVAGVCAAGGYDQGSNALIERLSHGATSFAGVGMPANLADVNGIAWLTSSTSIAVGDVGNDPYHRVTLRSTDAGRTWRRG